MTVKSNLTNVNVSMNTFEEIANALEALGVKVNPESPITITKDMAIKGPINYRQVTMKRDILMEVAKIYKNPIIDDFEVSNSEHFINFFDDVYQYVLTGEKNIKQTTVKTVETKKPSGW